MFRDLGIGAAIIQADSVEGDDAQTAFWTNLSAAILIALSLWLASSKLAGLLGDSQAAILIRWLALSFPAYALGATHQALLERNSSFKAIAGAETMVTVLSIVTGLAVAWHGFGATSLAIQTLANAFGSSIMLRAFLGPLPQGNFKIASFKKLAGFGGSLALFNTINFFSRNADNIIVGNTLGDFALGIYSQAYRVMMFPIQNITYAAGRAMLPVLSRKQSQPEEVWDTFLRSSALIATATAPFFLGIALLPRAFVHVVLGTQWEGCVPLLPWLCACGCQQALTSLTGTMLISKGKARLHLAIGMASATLHVTSFAVGIRFGLEQMTIFYFAAATANTVMVFSILIPVCKGRFLDYFRWIAPPILASATSLWLGKHFGVSLFQSELGLLLGLCLLGIPLCLITLRIASPKHITLLCHAIPGTNPRENSEQKRV